VLQPEGIADRDHEIADFGFSGVRERHFREAFRRYLQYRDIGVAIPADDLRLELAIVLQRHGDLGRVLDHVRIGDDVAVLRIDDHARAGTLKLAFARAVGNAEEAAIERVVEQRIAFLANRAFRRDVHDGRRGLLDDRCE